MYVAWPWEGSLSLDLEPLPWSKMAETWLEMWIGHPSKWEFADGKFQQGTFHCLTFPAPWWLTATRNSRRYGWWKKSCTIWYVVYPIVDYWLQGLIHPRDFFHQQYESKSFDSHCPCLRWVELRMAKSSSFLLSIICHPSSHCNHMQPSGPNSSSYGSSWFLSILIWRLKGMGLG